MKRSPLRVTPTTSKLSVKPKNKTCKFCKVRFTTFSSMVSWCSTDCGAALGMKAVEAKKAKDARIAAKVERMNDAARKDALKGRGEWIAEAQIAFNAFVRFRDRDQMCICCGKPFQPQKPGGSIDAGHYLSRGSACHLRFDERNVHAQRKNCNRPGGTTRAAFRAGMEARIGTEALEALECDQASREYTIDDLKAIKATYKLKLRELIKAGE